MSHIRALVAGSVTIDTIAVIAQSDVERVTMHNDAVSFLLVEQGRKVQAESISTHIGGGAANVAVSISRQGMDADVLGLTGEDLNAELIRARLGAEGVGLDHLLSSKSAATGTAIHVSAHDRDAAIFVARGANTRLQPHHIEPMDFSDYELVYVASLSNESSACFPFILEKAKRSDAFVVSNPGVRQIATRPEELLQNLPLIDLLALNRDEAAALIPHVLSRGEGRLPGKFDAGENPPRLLASGLHLAGFTMHLADAMTALTALGPKRVLVTDGSDGAYLSDGETLHYGPSVPVAPQGTAGAGDAFTSTVSAEIFRGANPRAALLAASINAASVVGTVDTQTGLLDQQSLKTKTAQDLKHYARKSWSL